jgi:predicted ATPase
VARYLQDGLLALNGDLVNLISGDEVLYRQAQSDGFDLRVEEAVGEADFVVESIEADNHLQKFSTHAENENWKALTLLGDDFVYLNAERLAPQVYYNLVNKSEKNYSRMGDKHGDKAVGVLFDAIDRVADLNIIALKNENASTNYVGENVSAWIGEIMGAKVIVKVEKVNEKDVKLSYTMGDVINENVFSSLNTAFGYSYLLPIVVAVLTAKVGGIILLENPEAHLHPAAQFRLGQFLALAAENGVQILVETHSDHLLNGIRVAVKRHELTSENVGIKYFSEKDGIHDAQSIAIDDHGGLDYWPNGFFDEWEKALDKLIS